MGQLEWGCIPFPHMICDGGPHLSELAARACHNIVSNIFVHAIPKELSLEWLVGLVAIMMFSVRIVVMQVLEPLLHSRVVWYIKNFTSRKMVSGIKRPKL